jgi:hypothetical protein
MINVLFFFLCYCSTVLAYHGTPVIWDRITQFKVNTHVSDFLNKQGIYNCYHYEEDRNNLYLKCWVDNVLINVDINIYNNDEVAYI